MLGMTTLVLGGTGKTGRRVVERLAARGVPTRVGSRSGEPPFDWRDGATWAPALRGVMVAAFLAAFMSTLGTQLNWGVSYLVNDLYRRFLAREKSEKHYVAIGRLFTILMVLLSGYVAGQLHSVGQGWQIVLGLGAGTGAVYMLRWYWWRINAWSEISAMSAAPTVSIYLQSVMKMDTDKPWTSHG